MNEQLRQFTTEQLKAMAYDGSVALQRIQQELQVLNQEIQERSRQKFEQANVQEEVKKERE